MVRWGKRPKAAANLARRPAAAMAAAVRGQVVESMGLYVLGMAAPGASPPLL